MANQIYSTTRDGLTDLVSARVASQVLDHALRASSYSAETVSVNEMARVLKGPVLKELANILPRAGLERSLKMLLKTLKALPPEQVPAAGEASPPPEAAAPRMAAADVDAAPPSKSSVTEGSGTENFATKNSAGENPAGESFAEVSVVAVGAPEQPTTEVLSSASVQAPVAERTRREHLKLEPAAREHFMLTFAQLEHVKIVAAFDGGGVSSIRGSGFEVEALSRLGTLGLKLLSRSGELRTLYIAHSQGQLFLFPFGNVTLLLIGSGELNLGLVFATLHKLEEEL